MEQLKHFTHDHELSLVQCQPITKNSDNEDEDEAKEEYEDTDDFVFEDHHVGKCSMCKEEIHSFHLCYYSCKDCDYMLHKFCAQLPTTQQNHPLHPDHNLTLSQRFQLHDPDFTFTQKFDSEWACGVCKVPRKMFYNYHCSICNFTMDIICASMSEHIMHHPGHPHQLQRNTTWMICFCDACGSKHSGTFYHCTICSWFKIHLDCALLPSKLLIQQTLNGSFSHSHSLTLAYSFPYIELRAKFFPLCRVCDNAFPFHKWHYRCNECQYYVHLDCATSKSEAFMSVIMPAGLGRTSKNFKDEDHPNLSCFPFPDESFNLLKQLFINKGEIVIKREIDGQMFSHPHPLILVDTLGNGSVSLHDPMKSVELLCDGCVRPITDLPFYKCSQHHCCFVLHEWCTRLPSNIEHYHDHPKHTLVLHHKVPTNHLGIFLCKICELPCNGFGYGCRQCKYYVDINCAFIPDVITHEAHPNHLLLRIKASSHNSKNPCKACKYVIGKQLGFHCPSCDIYLHAWCALMLPRTIRHKYDVHPLSLRYYPAENHANEYFCDICEVEFNPRSWFYHCSMCASFMHTACAPIKLECERSTFSRYKGLLFLFLNVKFGGRYRIKDHPHPVTFAHGIIYDGQCTVCAGKLQCEMIFKCSECRFACHVRCVRVLSKLVAIS